MERMCLHATFLFFIVTVVLSFPSFAKAWDEESFYRKTIIIARPFTLPQGPRDMQAQTIVGSPREYTIQKKDTLLDIARYFDLGYNELINVYPDLDPWIPPAGETLTLPTFWTLPKSGYEGIVVNIPEMRLYYFPPREKGSQRLVITLPVGLGREDWPTPVAKFKISGKVANPTWVIPESIKQERIAEKGWTEDFIPGGSPDNPMGKYKLQLTLPLYAIHDTNNPWAVGRLVTHGCIRLYPEDIQQFFDVVKVGVPGEFVYQPVKIGFFNGKIYAEVHEDIYGLVPDLWQEAQKAVQESGWEDLVDNNKLLKVLMKKTGMPTDVTKGLQYQNGNELRYEDHDEEERKQNQEFDDFTISREDVNWQGDPWN
ncbi:MAG: L,D-transpeptidase family protein [Candidatus Binatia bacterium]